jgi:Tfp pilus assembly protein PilF
MKLVPVPVFLLCIVSCTQQRLGNIRKPASVAPPSAMLTTFERQIANAHYAGEGDYLGRSLQARVAAEPDNIELRLELARHYQQVGSPELALEHYRLAAARAPGFGPVQILMAKCLRSMGLRVEAAGGLEKFSAKYPQNSPEFSSWLGILRDELGQWEQGEADHRAALALAPNRDDLHNNLGYNLLQQKKYNEAAEEFRRALALRPDSAIARNNLGLALASSPAEAVRHWQAASDPATAHNNLAAVLIEQGRYGEARKELEIALGYERNHPAALTNLRLITELDGQPAFIPSKRSSPAWKRFLAALWRELAGIEERPQPQPVRTASR